MFEKVRKYFYEDISFWDMSFGNRKFVEVKSFSAPFVEPIVRKISLEMFTEKWLTKGRVHLKLFHSTITQVGNIPMQNVGIFREYN